MVQQFKPVSTFLRMVPFTLSSAYPSKPSSFRPLLSDYHGNQEGNLCEALLQWERNEYFIPEGKKKEESVNMGYFGYLLSPLASACSSDVGGPGQALWRMGGGGALDPRPSGAPDVLCDLE